MEDISRRVEHKIPTDILDDLLTRFLICVPDSAKANYIRICFQIEMAHWFYLDFYVSNDSKLKSCTIYDFAAHVFQHIPSLQREIHKLPEILAEWKKYKQTVPTYGAILLSEGLTHVLLVKSYWAKASWGFPKGKVNEEEDPAHCAIREVLEETGFDITSRLDPDDWVESVINDQLVRLYIIKNIPMSTKFQPKTRCEIKSCDWFDVNNLPTNKKDLTPKLKIGVSSNAFFMVLPFVKKLKQICSGIPVKRHRQKSTNSLSDCETSASRSKNKSIIKSEEEKHNNSKRHDKKNGSKRQLFPSSCPREPKLYAPSWVNFKFDRTAIIECIP
ncbi:hypothetical protein WA026_003768 [Henosepilachna vigintioctopunctata]|uniref:m7GpppN-mRNA hydrolase n=1 Tax=Henosepilachna vigintioctopunctata TaxID=420089 RepID=A0AAW1UEF8_9CUCU